MPQPVEEVEEGEEELILNELVFNDEIKEEPIDIGLPEFSRPVTPQMRSLANIQQQQQVVQPRPADTPRLSIRTDLTTPTPMTRIFPNAPTIVPPAEIRDPRIIKRRLDSEDTVQPSQRATPAVAPKQVKIEPDTVDHAKLPIRILDVRSVTGSLEEISRSLETPHLSFGPLQSDSRQSQSSYAIPPEMQNSSPLVRSTRNPVFLSQATEENVDSASLMHPHRDVSLEMRQTAQLVGYSLDREVFEELSSGKISDTSFNPKANKRSSSTQTSGEGPEKRDKEMQTTDNTGDYYFTADMVKKLSESDLKLFHDLRRRMGLELKGTIPDILERNAHRLANARIPRPRTLEDEREAFQNPQAPNSGVPPAPILKTRPTPYQSRRVEDEPPRRSGSHDRDRDYGPSSSSSRYNPYNRRY